MITYIYVGNVQGGKSRYNRGDGRLLYFYHDGNAHLIDEEIKRTWGVLKFRADSVHNPTMRVQEPDAD